MILSIFEHRRIRQGLTLVFLAGAMVCMFPPGGLPVFAWWASQAPFVALGYLLLGLLFLVAGQTRLMVVCLACSAAISFFFNESGERAHSYDAPVGCLSGHFVHHELFIAHVLASPSR